MVKRLLMLVMALQVVAAIGIAWALARVMPADVALLLAVIVVLLVRMAIAANNFRMAARPLPEGAQLDWRQRVQLFFHEFASTMMATSWHMLRHRPRLHVAQPARGLPGCTWPPNWRRKATATPRWTWSPCSAISTTMRSRLKRPCKRCWPPAARTG
jgi:hypothetical protein